jgi:dihydropteroate synthase
LDLLDNYNIDFSVDTCRSEVVKKIIKYKNLVYINDISGLKDEKILSLIENTNI